MSADTLREGRQNTEFYSDLLASVMREVSAGVYQLVTTTGISDRVMSTLREGRPDVPYFDDLWSKVMSYDAGTGKWYLNVSGGGGGGGNLQTTLDNGDTADGKELNLTYNTIDNKIQLDPINSKIENTYQLYVSGRLSNINVGVGTNAGLLELLTNNSGGVQNIHKIHPASASTGSVDSSFTHNLQREDGYLLQNINQNGLGLRLDGGDLDIQEGDVFVNGDGKGLIVNDDTNQKYITVNNSGLVIQHTDGAGTPDYPLLNASENGISFYDTAGGGTGVQLIPNQFNDQIITLPDITGGMKTVGTWTETFSSGVITLTDARFDYGTPNFSVMITDVNGSSALAHNYKFELLTLPTRAKITALKSNGTTETSDVSIVRISCLF